VSKASGALNFPPRGSERGEIEDLRSGVLFRSVLIMAVFDTADHFFMKKLCIMMKVVLHPPTDIDYFPVGMVKNINDLADIV